MDNSSPVFVMPHWSEGDEQSTKYVREAIKSILSQSDQNFELVIVDDCSNDKAKESLKNLTKDNRNTHVIFKDKREGAGPSRNVGIKWAKDRGAPFVLFLDADDIAHPERLKKTREIFQTNPKATVVYSPFIVIDEDNNHVPLDKLTPMLVEHLDSHAPNPPVGNNAWIRIGLETGYTNLTSSTSVRTWLASEVPFCNSKAGEDAHCWLRYSATGDEFIFTNEVPTLYRVPQNKVGGSSSRALIGREEFYKTYARTIESSFIECITIALAKGKIGKEKEIELLTRFYVRTAETLSKEGELNVVEEYLKKASSTHKDWTDKALRERFLSENIWAKPYLLKN